MVSKAFDLILVVNCLYISWAKEKYMLDTKTPRNAFFWHGTTTDFGWNALFHIYFFSMLCAHVFLAWTTCCWVQKLGIAPLHPAGPAGSNEVSFVLNGAKEVLEARKTCAKTRVGIPFSFPANPTLKFKWFIWRWCWDSNWSHFLEINNFFF